MGKKKILVIDDEKDFTKLIKFNLERTGRYEVRTENQPTLSLAATKEFKPDLILLDILMPAPDGSEVASQLQDDEDTKKIPIIFLTAIIGEKEAKASGGVIGGRVFVAKPVEIKQLIEVIEKNI